MEIELPIDLDDETPGIPFYVELWRPKRCNCLVWALVMQYLWGGYVCLRQSIYPFWKHAVWSLDGRHWYEYASVDQKKALIWWKKPNVLWFRGAPIFIRRRHV